MAMFQCPECGTSIADNSISCPSCGWKNKYQAAKKKVTRWSVVSIVFAVMGVIWPFTINEKQLFYNYGATAITINGIPIQVALAIPALFVIVISIIIIAAKSKAATIILTIISLILMWGSFLLYAGIGTFGQGLGFSMFVGIIITSIAQILSLIASRNLRIPKNQQVQSGMTGNSDLEKHRYNAQLQYVDKTPKQ